MDAPHITSALTSRSIPSISASGAVRRVELREGAKGYCQTRQAHAGASFPKVIPLDHVGLKLKPLDMEPKDLWYPMVCYGILWSLEVSTFKPSQISQSGHQIDQKDCSVQRCSEFQHTRDHLGPQDEPCDYRGMPIPFTPTKAKGARPNVALADVPVAG